MMRKYLICLAIVLSLVLAGCGEPPLPPATVIDLSHAGTDANGFGDDPKPNYEQKRWQTFIAIANYPALVTIEVKIRRYGSGTWSPVRAELYATDDAGKPTGPALAYSLISPDRIPADKSFVEVETGLYYASLTAGAEYAVVLTQETLSYAHYEWCDRQIAMDGLHFGVFSDAGWVESAGCGNGWLKVHVRRAAPAAIFLFAAGLHDGNLKGAYATARAGADAIALANVPAGLAGKTVHAFITIDTTDCIAMMPYDLGFFPTDIPIKNADGSVKIADDWADLLDGSIDIALEDAILMPDSTYWWSGSRADGTFYMNCGGWDENDGSSYGACGYKVDSDGSWLSAGGANSSAEYYILGIAY